MLHKKNAAVPVLSFEQGAETADIKMTNRQVKFIRIIDLGKIRCMDESNGILELILSPSVVIADLNFDKHPAKSIGNQ